MGENCASTPDENCVYNRQELLNVGHAKTSALPQLDCSVVFKRDRSPIATGERYCNKGKVNTAHSQFHNGSYKRKGQKGQCCCSCCTCSRDTCWGCRRYPQDRGAQERFSKEESRRSEEGH